MPRDTPVIITKRSARFSTANHDEVELTFPFEGNADHADNGKKQHAFYTAERYDSKQQEHGRETYPDPFTDGHFKR